jgi:hypothetical protein
VNWAVGWFIVTVIVADLAFKAGFKRGVRSVRRQQNWRYRTYRRVS